MGHGDTGPSGAVGTTLERVANSVHSDAAGHSDELVLAQRQQHYGFNASIMYREPLHIQRGQGCLLFDTDGNDYLDCVNNVAHVGHSHPKVTEEVCKQLATLNTNSRYLSAGLSSYVARLAATMPEPLEVVYMVCSGSEANDLSLRIALAAGSGQAEAAAHANHLLVIDGAYHGNTLATIDVSPYKFWGPGGAGRPQHIHVLPCPDPYRGAHLDGRAAAEVAVDEVRAAGGKVCAVIVESLLSCGGQVVLPEGYLKDVFAVVREAGGMCISDEVQCGFGRIGSHFWGFESQGVVPDIVTLGKPIGNGFPAAALVTTAEISRRFAAGGMAYFNTFGGCNAAVAAAAAVLSVLEQERLQDHAASTGEYMLQKLRELAKETDVIGDVRGRGLFVGLEMVQGSGSQAPAPATAAWLKERMKARRVLLSTDGIYDNVIKIKPPMCFAAEHVDRLVRELTDVLNVEFTAERRAQLHEHDTAWQMEVDSRRGHVQPTPGRTP